MRYLLALLISVPAQASVWNGMQENVKLARIMQVTPQDGDVLIEFITVEDSGQKVTRIEKLCIDNRPAQETEEMRVMFLKVKIDEFRSAMDRDEPVKIGLRGPWSPCVSSISRSAI